MAGRGQGYGDEQPPGALKMVKDGLCGCYRARGDGQPGTQLPYSREVVAHGMPSTSHAPTS